MYLMKSVFLSKRITNNSLRVGRAISFYKKAFPAAEADLAADSLILAIAGGGVGDLY